MRISKLLRHLLMPFMFHVVEDEGGGAAVVDETPADDEAAPADDAPADEAVPADDDADEVVITLGDEPPPEPEADDAARAPGWLRDLRKANREKDRRIRELEQRLNANAPAPAAQTIGTRPTLADCGYDEDKHAEEVAAWVKRKHDIEAQQAKAQADAEAQNRAYLDALAAHDKAKTELKVPDFEDAEAAVEEKFSTVQRAIIVKAARGKSAALTYAIGKNPAELQRLAAITDPVDFTWAVAQLETKLKVTPRKGAPVPERTIRGAVPGSTAARTQLDQLRAEAEKTGDYTKVTAFKRAQRAAQA